MSNLVLHHELKNFLDCGFRRLMCELIHDNTDKFIKMINYMSKLEKKGIPYSTKRKSNKEIFV